MRTYNNFNYIILLSCRY